MAEDTQERVEEHISINGNVGKINYTISVEKLKVDEIILDGIQIVIGNELTIFSYQSDGLWKNVFIHTPQDENMRLNFKPIEYPEPIWLPHEKRDKLFKKYFKGFGISEEDRTILLEQIRFTILANAIPDNVQHIIDLNVMSGASINTDEINYWYMIDKKFSAYMVSSLVIETFKEQEHQIKTVKETKEILIFNNGVYVNGEDEIEGMIRNQIGALCTIAFVKEVMQEIRISTLVLKEKFNPGQYINLLNGVYMINLKTFKHIDDDVYNERDMLFTYKLPVHYNSKALCPQIDAFFAWAMPDKDKREQIYEEFAYCFKKGYPIQKMFLWYGSGKNGKGTAVKILEHIIGKNNMAGWNIENLEKNFNYCQADIVGKKVNVCGELPDRRVPFDYLKAATGGDIISVREIYKKPYSVVNDTKFFFMMNKVPEFSDFTGGLMRRLIIDIWESELTSDEVDPNYVNHLVTDAEISGFFNKLMNALDELSERGYFTNNMNIEEVETILSELRGEDLDAFISERCVISHNLKYARKPLYDDYCNWCKLRHSVSKGKKVFNAFLRNRGFKTSQIAGERIWQGIALQEESKVISNINKIITSSS